MASGAAGGGKEERVLLVGGNWKMNGSVDLIGQFGREDSIVSTEGVQVLVAPPSLYLVPAQAVLSPRCLLASQTVSEHGRGAFTGEISASMLMDVAIKWTLIGHSERRTLYGEDDARVRAKLCTAWAAGLSVILCVGESLQVRSQGDKAAEAFVCSQLEASLAPASGGAAATGISFDNPRPIEKDEDEAISGHDAEPAAQQHQRLVIAYEPIWAIGTGQVASAAAAQRMHAIIRHWLAAQFGPSLARHIRIIYGGSVTAAGAEELIQQVDIDGFLVGGASLKPAEFGTIIQTVKRQKAKGVQ